tara:strand:+ start:186 stop:1178 length:993 start_codon:yes stop_codon:yes gene_type:complete
MEQIIQVKNLKKSFKTFKREAGLLNAFKSMFSRKYKLSYALKGIDFEVQKGEILGFIGPNGAGKSTTIKALSGILFPSSGTVKVMDYVPWKERVKYVKNIGVVFGQKHQLHWDLPPIDTYYLNKELYQIPDKAFKRRLRYMVNLLDLKETIKTPVRDLSLGERMKCKLVSALLHNPKIVFLDEPTIGLDAIAKHKLREFVKYVNEKYQTTFIITTHNMDDIEKLCKRIVIINHGTIVYDGSLDKIKKSYVKYKVLDVKFDNKAPIFRLPGCKVIEREKYELKIEVNTRRQSVKTVVDHLIRNYPFEDMVISDPPIEEIIQLIYQTKKKIE